MVKPIDKLGMGPSRTYRMIARDKYLVTVTPPAWSGIKEGKSILLSFDQYDRYLSWMQTGMRIQDALPELTPDEREILLNGT